MGRLVGKMHCCWCHIESGSLTLKEHEAARWLNVDEMESVKWLPADLQLLPKIRKETATI